MTFLPPPTGFQKLIMRNSAFLFFLLFLVIPAKATTRFVATNGSDSNSGATASPFLTMNKCYQSSASGDICSMRAGNYPDQPPISPHLACGAVSQYADGDEVTFQPESGKVSIDGLHVSNINAATTCHITFQDLTFTDFVQVGTADDIHFIRTIHRALVQVAGGHYISFTGTPGTQLFEVGPFTDAQGDGIEIYPYGVNRNPPNQNVVIEDFIVHGVNTNVGSAHPDAIAPDQCVNCAVRRGTFTNNCGIYRGGALSPSFMTIENTYMGPPVPCAGIAYGFTASITGPSLVRFNTIDGPVQPPVSPYDENMTWDSNIVTGNAWGGCFSAAGTTAKNNIWSTSNSSSCGTSNVRVSSFAGWFTDPSNGNYDLTTAATSARNAGNPSSFPTTDIHRIARVSPPDAGADQLGSSQAGSGTPPDPPSNLTAIVQ